MTTWLLLMLTFLSPAVGASDNPCSQTYAGPSGSSEREAQALTAYVLNLKTQGNFLYYFAFHSFSQMILIPFSHVEGADVLLVPNYADMVSFHVDFIDYTIILSICTLFHTYILSFI